MLRQTSLLVSLVQLIYFYVGYRCTVWSPCSAKSMQGMIDK